MRTHWGVTCPWIPRACASLGNLGLLWVPRSVSAQHVPCVYVPPLLFTSSRALSATALGAGGVSHWLNGFPLCTSRAKGGKARVSLVIDIAVALVEHYTGSSALCVYLPPSLDLVFAPSCTSISTCKFLLCSAGWWVGWTLVFVKRVCVCVCIL